MADIYAKMTGEELIALQQKLGADIQKIKATRHAIQVELDVRAADLDVKKIMASLSEKGKEKLKQVISMEGVSSAEMVGKPQ